MNSDEITTGVLGNTKAWAIYDRWPEQRYRYALARQWDPALPVAVCCLLNPSKATHLVVDDDDGLDPTMRRWDDFARSWGYGGWITLNAYAWIATEPKDLPRLDRRPSTRAIGPANDSTIVAQAKGMDVLVGWGAGVTVERERQIFRLLSSVANGICCLGLTKEGSPRHPLYMPKLSERVSWSPR